MLNRRSIILVLVCAALLTAAGCGGNAARTEYNNKLKAAFSQLEKGEPETAAAHLEQAKQIADENGFEAVEVDRLLVEANMGLGNMVDAHAQAKTLLDADAEDPFANELMGKIQLKQGEYAEAEKHFVAAQENYQAELDVVRAGDLLAMSRYCSAYERGNPRLAESYLREIRNADLQHALDKAHSNVMARGR